MSSNTINPNDEDPDGNGVPWNFTAPVPPMTLLSQAVAKAREKQSGNEPQKPSPPPKPEITPEQREQWRLEREKRDREASQEREIAERKRQLGLLADKIGSKYMSKKWSDRELYGTAAEQEKQRVAFAKVDTFLENIKDNIKAGRNLVLVGPPGTGKDYALASCMREAIIRTGARSDWHNGAQLFIDLRGAMNGTHREGLTFEHIIWFQESAPIVAWSDPVPAIGPLTEFQATTLLTIADSRYRHDKPIWITLNVSSRKEAESRMGPMLIDRLFENAEVIFFDWSSYREFSRTKAK